MGVSADIYFDPTLIQANQVFEGDLFPVPPHFYPGTIDNPNGTITDIIILVFSWMAVSDPGYFVNILFTAQQKLGTSPLDLQNILIADIYGQSLPSTVIDGEVTVGEEPPQITNVMLITSDPLDTQPSFGWENFTCTVTDDVGIDEVKLIINYSGNFPEYLEFLMTNIPGTDVYYYYTTFIYPGHYNYKILVKDTNGNIVESQSEIFNLPPNHDVNMDGKIHFLDLIAIAGMYGTPGPCGWVREDVDNNGRVHFMDLSPVALHYNEYW